jgi:hypothetical protein
VVLGGAGGDTPRLGGLTPFPALREVSVPLGTGQSPTRCLSPSDAR